MKNNIEIHLGDECVTRYGKKFIVTKVRDYKDAGATIDGVGLDGDTVGGEYSSALRKTGRYFPDVPDLLKKIRELGDDE